MTTNQSIETVTDMETLRAWANAQMRYASEEFYDADTFDKNCTRSARKDTFWEVDSPDMGSNRAQSGSISFYVEWACYVASNWGVDAVIYAGKVQDRMAAQYQALLPRINAAASAINALVRHEG
jgi:hypothetical protein